MTRKFHLALLIASSFQAAAGTATAGKSLGDIGTFAKWARIEIAFEGPRSNAESGQPNPFLIDVRVRFTAPRGKTYEVPAYFDGDGKGGRVGTIWKVRFSADERGRWRFSTSSTEPPLDGWSGFFDVTAPPPDAPKLYRWGRLEFVGRPYLKFADGPYWLKGGADSPENFLGKALGDWSRKKSEVDYLARQGVNCVYIMTQNIDGDGRDVWPWIGATEKEAKANHRRFDPAKLRRWQDFFEYIQRRGIAIQIVLNDDSAWLGYDHRLYLREMVARFGYLPAIYWNIGEEYNEAFHTFGAAQRYARLLAELDPYDHPIALHNVNELSKPMILDPNLNVTSIQTDPLPPREIHRIAVEWRRAAEKLGRPIVVSFDEGRPPMKRASVWAAYLGGAMWEAIDTDLEKDPSASFRKDEKFWREMRLARKFLEALPFWKMKPADELVEGGFCLAQKGKVYAIYTPTGGTMRLNLAGAAGKFDVRWCNPATGKFVRGPVRSVEGGRTVSLGHAPFDGDAAAVVVKRSLK